MWADKLLKKQAPASARAAVKPLTPAWESQLRSRVDLSQRACHATLLGFGLAGMPRQVKQQQAEAALSLWGQLYVESFYKGDSAQCAEDNAFYADGAALVARDFGRRGHLLLRLPAFGRVSQTAAKLHGEEAIRMQLQQDAWSLLLFSFLAMNTFPLTPAVLSWLLRHAPWLPRRWLLPSQFEQRRLDGLRRARALAGASGSKESLQAVQFRGGV